MSVELSYSVPGRNLDQLHDALRRAAALLTPPADTDNTPEAVWGDDPDIFLTMPDDVDEPGIDAIVAAHIPQTVYDTTDKLAELATLRERSRLRADYDRVEVLFRAVVAATVAVNPTLAAVLEEATALLIDVLKRRDRAAGVYY